MPISDTEFFEIFMASVRQSKVRGYRSAGYKRVHRRKFPVLLGPQGKFFRLGKGLSRTYLEPTEFRLREPGTTKFNLSL